MGKIDNPLDQALAQMQSEQRSADPALEQFGRLHPFLSFGKHAAGVLAAGDLSSMVSMLKDWSDSFSRDRSQYLLSVVISELQVLWEKFKALDSSHQEYLDRDWPTLLLDALRKAGQTTSRERISRIGRILSSAAYAPRPLDETEDLTRIAMDLDDGDVRVLGQLVRGQEAAFAASLGRVDDDAANDFWRTGNTKSTMMGQEAFSYGNVTFSARLGISEGELQSRCAKLQSFGLVVQIERRPDRNAPGIIPVAVLARGIEFVKAIQSMAGAEEPSKG